MYFNNIKFMFSILFDPQFIIFYVISNLFLSIYIYFKTQKYIHPYIKKNKGEKEKNLHDNYPEFNRINYKDLNFARIFLGLIFLVWFKLILAIFFLLLYYIYLK